MKTSDVKFLQRVKMKFSKLIITAALLFAASILSAQDVDTGIDMLKEQKFKIRVDGREGQKHGQVEIGINAIPGDHCRQNRTHHADEVKDVEFKGTPLVLQPVANEHI